MLLCVREGEGEIETDSGMQEEREKIEKGKGKEGKKALKVSRAHV